MQNKQPYKHWNGGQEEEGKIGNNSTLILRKILGFWINYPLYHFLIITILTVTL